MNMDKSRTFRPQVAYFDHVFAVVDAGTADEIADSDFLRGFGMFEVGTTATDMGSWTGRYLFGRRTYVELFGPDDLEGPEAQEGAVGLGLSSRSRGGLKLVSDQMATLGGRAEQGRRMLDEDNEQKPWFDYLKSVGPSQIFGTWVSEDLTAQSDLEVRESRYLDWTNPPGEAADAQDRSSAT